MIGGLLGLFTLYSKKVFIFAVLGSFVFKYHIAVRLRTSGDIAIMGRKSVTGSMLDRKWQVVWRRKHVRQVPYPVAAGQRVQLVAAHGDGLVQGLHGGPAGGPRVEAARHVHQPLIVFTCHAISVPFTGPAPADLK